DLRAVLPLGSRAGWSFRRPCMWSSTPQRVLFPIDNVRLGSAREDRRVATLPEFVYRPQFPCWPCATVGEDARLITTRSRLSGSRARLAPKSLALISPGHS